MLGPCLTSTVFPDIQLAPFREENVSDIYVGWMREPEVIRFTEVVPETATLESCQSYVAASNFSDISILWRIIAAEEGHVGNIRLGINAKHRRGELGLIVGRTDLHGRGIGTGAIHIASEYAFSDLDLWKLTCGIYADNGGSITAFERNGFQVEAIFQNHVLVEGRFQNVLRMARFSTEKPAT